MPDTAAVKILCERLAPLGWRTLLLRHGLDIAVDDIVAEFRKPLSIDRSVPGFHDFAIEGSRGIEPGRPAYSLIFHALASPGVADDGEGRPLQGFPTLAELESIENYIYACRRLSLAELRANVGDAALAIAVFAYEYRDGARTVHQRHADFCFSRTGISRVGNAAADYIPQARGFLPFGRGKGDIRALPARYAPFIAVQLHGDRASFGPMDFHCSVDDAVDVAGVSHVVRKAGDQDRMFWVPVHKLFSGSKCLLDRDLRVQLQASHVNEKLRKVHRALAAEGLETGWHEPDLSDAPFRVTTGLASFSKDADAGSGLLCPEVHELVEVAQKNGSVVAYRVPRTTPRIQGAPLESFSSSLHIQPKSSGVRGAPEYVHARSKLMPDGKVVDLNDFPNVLDAVSQGGYEAVHYTDFSADGWIRANVSGLTLDIPRNLAAFSIIAPPDFFPLVDQRTLMQWWQQSAPPEIYSTIWPANPGPPLALSDSRYPPNQELPGSGFTVADDTITAIVATVGAGRDAQSRIRTMTVASASTLPDGAAGIFAPGWDSSIDRTSEVDPNDDGRIVLPGTTFLATYGLGSPFPEDAKLCAALSAYWPAAAPDITRSFEPGTDHPSPYATTTPLPDDVLGWDGLSPPSNNVQNKEVECAALAYGDFVRAALSRSLDITKIGNTTSEEYIARTVAMARVYAVLGAATTAEKAKYSLFSFRRASAVDEVLAVAQREAGISIDAEYLYRLEMCRVAGIRYPMPSDPNFNKAYVRYDEMMVIFAAPTAVLHRGGDGGAWRAVHF